MFTGIIRHIGKVVSLETAGSPRKLTVHIGPLAESLAIGDSVSVAGACLTATAIAGSEAAFDVASETLSRTTLGGLRAGGRVNLELALRVGQGLDGHIVQGHVDGPAELKRVGKGGQHVMEFSAPTELTDQMVPKGSVAIDGVSLTLVDVGAGRFSVALIPKTLEATTLAEVKISDRVNIEVDILGKYVRKHLATLAGGKGTSAGALTMESLRQAGFE